MGVSGPFSPPVPLHNNMRPLTLPDLREAPRVLVCQLGSVPLGSVLVSPADLGADLGQGKCNNQEWNLEAVWGSEGPPQPEGVQEGGSESSHPNTGFPPQYLPTGLLSALVQSPYIGKPLLLGGTQGPKTTPTSQPGRGSLFTSPLEWRDFVTPKLGDGHFVTSPSWDVSDPLNLGAGVL